VRIATMGLAMTRVKAPFLELGSELLLYAMEVGVGVLKNIGKGKIIKGMENDY